MTDIYVIHVTKLCNMNCLYCYERDKVSEYSLEELKTTADLIFLNLKEPVYIEFLGGEPLLRFDLILELLGHIKSKYTDRYAGSIITTNGSLLPERLTDFLLENPDVQLSISLDGHKFSNQLRQLGERNSYDTVVSNIKLLQRSGINPMIHMVTHPLNIAYLFDSVVHLYEDLKLNRLGIGTVESTMDLDDAYFNTFKSQILQLISYVKNHPELHIDLLEALKPSSDKRSYYKDKKTGKVLFENYGRAENQIDPDRVELQAADKEPLVQKLIHSAREFAYKSMIADVSFLAEEILRVSQNLIQKIS